MPVAEITGELCIRGVAAKRSESKMGEMVKRLRSKGICHVGSDIIRAAPGCKRLADTWSSRPSFVDTLTASAPDDGADWASWRTFTEFESTSCPVTFVPVKKFG